MQGPEPSTDGATSLGVVAMTIVKGPSLKSPSFDAQRVAIPCHATLPSDARVRLHTTRGARRAVAIAAALGMRNATNLLGWSVWVIWWSERSRAEVSCHQQTRTVGQLSHVSHGRRYASLCR